MRIKSLIGYACLLTPLFASSVYAQSMNEAIDAAIASEPKFQAVKIGESIAQSKLKAVKSETKPSLGLQGSYGASNADFGMGYKEIYPRNLAIAWEMRLYDGGESLAKISAEDFALAATKGETLNAKLQLISETAEAYANYYAANKANEFAQANIDASARYARDAKLQFDVGEISNSEKSFADAAYARSQSLSAQTNGQKQLAAANLLRLTGLEINNPSLNDADTQIPASLNEAIEIAKANHPMLATAKARVAQAEAQYKLANTSYMPKVTLSARASTVRDQFLSGYRADDYGAYVNFSMPLYTYGRISSGVEMAKNGREQAKQAYNATERGVIMAVKAAYTDLSTAIAQKTAAQSALNASQIAMKSVDAELKVGQRPLKDALDARRDLTMSQMDLAKAEAAIIIAKYKIRAAIGN